jgi:hypothetical protein
MLGRPPSRWVLPWRRAEVGATAAVLRALVERLPGLAALLAKDGAIEKANSALAARLGPNRPPGGS